MSKKTPQRGIRLLYHPQAQDDLLTSLDPSVQSDVVAWVDRLNGRTQPELVSMLETRSERKVFQKEASAQGGTLRVVFAWGKGCLWMIGAFVKVNEPDGERHMKRILPRAAEVKDWDEHQ